MRWWIFCGEPVEEPMARECLLAQRRRLDLRVLDRVAAHVVAVGSADAGERDGPFAWADGDEPRDQPEA